MHAICIRQYNMPAAFCTHLFSSRAVIRAVVAVSWHPGDRTRPWTGLGPDRRPASHGQGLIVVFLGSGIGDRGEQGSACGLAWRVRMIVLLWNTAHVLGIDHINIHTLQAGVCVPAGRLTTTTSLSFKNHKLTSHWDSGSRGQVSANTSIHSP